MKKITARIAADYLGITPMAVTMGMRNALLPIGFAIHNEERDRGPYSESWTYVIVPERLIAYNHGRINEIQVKNPGDLVVRQLSFRHKSRRIVRIQDGEHAFRFFQGMGCGQGQQDQGKKNRQASLHVGCFLMHGLRREPP